MGTPYPLIFSAPPSIWLYRVLPGCAAALSAQRRVPRLVWDFTDRITVWSVSRSHVSNDAGNGLSQFRNSRTTSRWRPDVLSNLSTADCWVSPLRAVALAPNSTPVAVDCAV